jgi:hypothetical protein
MPLGGTGKHVGLKLNGTHQLLAHANYANLLGDRPSDSRLSAKLVPTFVDYWETAYPKEKHRKLTDNSKEVGPQVNCEKTKYMSSLITRMQSKIMT